MDTRTRPPDERERRLHRWWWRLAPGWDAGPVADPVLYDAHDDAGLFPKLDGDGVSWCAVSDASKAAPIPWPPEGERWRWGAPPTSAQRVANEWWCAVDADHVDHLYSIGDGPDMAQVGVAWWAPDDNNPWPTVINDDHWYFADGSDCPAHPAAAGFEWCEDLAYHQPGWRAPGFASRFVRVCAGGRVDGCGFGGEPAQGHTIADRVTAAFDAMRPADTPAAAKKLSHADALDRARALLEEAANLRRAVADIGRRAKRAEVEAATILHDLANTILRSDR